MSTLSRPLTAQDIFSSSSTPRFALGQKGETTDGRIFRYCKAGAADLVPGYLQQNAAEDSNFLALAVASTYAIGSKTVVITLNGTAVTASMFAEGYLIITLGTGLGYQYKIRAHSVQTSTTGALTIDLEDALIVALDTTSRVTIKRNPYSGVILAPVTPTGAIVGAAVYPVTALYYGWIQVGGVYPLMGDASTAPTVGGMVSPSNNTGDEGEACVGALAQGLVGNAVSTGAAGYFRPVMLRI